MKNQITAKRKIPVPLMMTGKGIAAKIFVKLDRFCGELVVLRKKSKYMPKVTCNTLMVQRMASFGLAPEEIAFIYGVTGLQFRKAVRQNAELQRAVEGGRQIADMAVTDSLFKKAAGYYRKEFRMFKYRDKMYREPYSKFIPPEMGAITLWLTNRRPEQWKMNPQYDKDSRYRPKIPPEEAKALKAIVEASRRGEI